MQPQNDALVVRQHERVRCQLACQLGVAQEHAAIVTLSPLAADGNGQFEASLVDLSRGGAGVRTKVFVPKLCRVSVRISDPAAGPDGLVLNLRVMRVTMIDRAPTYELGMAMVDLSPADAQRIAAVIGSLAAAQRAAAPVSGPSLGVTSNA